MKNFLILCLMLFVSKAMAQSGQVSVNSNYLWRGTTFSDNQPVAQLALEAPLAPGVYVSTFVSNATMLDPSRDKMTHEVDAIVGYRFGLNNAIVDIYHNHYFFPEASAYETHETTLLISQEKTSLSLAQMDNFFGYQTIYRSARLTQSFQYKESLEGAFSLGYNTFVKQKKAGNTDYFDFQFINKKILADESSVSLTINLTNRKLYSDESKESAKDLMFVLGYSLPIQL